MKLRTILIIMITIAVLSDYMLHPFYPQFFQERFGINSPKEVGYYFAAICFMVMISFPFWAFVSKNRSELKILIFTQPIAGVLALLCFYVEDYTLFWGISLLMILFKSSYLLAYPYVLKMGEKENHTNTIALMSVLVHFGSILGAIIGGIILDQFNPGYIFLIMGASDFVLALFTAYILYCKKFDFLILKEKKEPNEKQNLKSIIPTGFILKLGLITFSFYLSAFFIRPFFSVYWESISIYDSKLISGIIYAIPGMVAFIVLLLQYSKKTENNSYYKIPWFLFIGAIGLALQALELDYITIIGRIIYGLATFKLVVHFDVLLFKKSTPESYSIDYSKVHFFQNLGVLLASLSVGITVDQFGLSIPFHIAIIGFLITFILYYLLIHKKEIIHE